MDARDYEQDVLCDLPTADLKNWALRRYPSTGDSSSTNDDLRMGCSTSDGTRLSACDDSDVCEYHGYAYIEDSEDQTDFGRKYEDKMGICGVDDEDDLDSGAIPRVATPIPASTMRHTYLEAVRELIDAESGGESIPSASQQQQQPHHHHHHHNHHHHQHHRRHKSGRLSALKWPSYRKIRTPRPSFSKRHSHKRSGKPKWSIMRSVARAFRRSPKSRA